MNIIFVVKPVWFVSSSLIMHVITVKHRNHSAKIGQHICIDAAHISVGLHTEGMCFSLTGPELVGFRVIYIDERLTGLNSFSLMKYLQRCSLLCWGSGVKSDGAGVPEMERAMTGEGDVVDHFLLFSLP